jgi:CheY-like chemotaxis protein
MQLRARAAGASFFVTKPITVDALQKNVARFIR